MGARRKKNYIYTIAFQAHVGCLRNNQTMYTQQTIVADSTTELVKRVREAYTNLRKMLQNR